MIVEKYICKYCRENISEDYNLFREHEAACLRRLSPKIKKDKGLVKIITTKNLTEVN